MPVNYAPPTKSVDPFVLALLAQQQSSGSSDQEIALQKMMLAKLSGGVGDSSPVGHWTQGLARMAQGGMAGLEMGSMLADAKARQAESADILGNIPGVTGGGAPAPAPQPSPGPMGALGGMGKSIAALLAGGGSPAPIGGPSAMPTYPMEGAEPPVAPPQQMAALPPQAMSDASPPSAIARGLVGSQPPMPQPRPQQMAYAPPNQPAPPPLMGLGDMVKQGGYSPSANFMRGQFGGPGENLTQVAVPGITPFPAHKEAAPAFEGALKDFIAAGAPVKTVGGYNHRNIAGTGRLSQHAYGNAMDLEQRGRNIVSPEFAAWAKQNPEIVRNITAKWGLVNGGDWRSPDFGHFEWSGKRPWENQDRVQVASLGGGMPQGRPPQGAPAPQQMAQAQQLQQKPRSGLTPEQEAWYQRAIRSRDPRIQAEALKRLEQWTKPQTLKPHNAGDEVLFHDDQANIVRREPMKLSTDDLRELDRENAHRRQNGMPELGPKEYIEAIKRAGATNVRVGDENLTPGWKKIDEKFADEYVNWSHSGQADTNKQLGQVSKAIGILRQSVEKGEPITGAVGLLPETMQPFVNERGVIAKEAIEEVVQRNLRVTLGSQFTEREGERLIARAYNPLLPPQENLRRAQRLFEQVQAQAEAKQGMVDYFDQNGTLRGYKGARPKMIDPNSIGPEVSGAPVRRFNPATGRIE